MELIAIAATSLDGFITKGTETGTAFTSQADKQWFGKVLKTFPVKIMGRKTFDVSRDQVLELIRNGSNDLRIVITRSPHSFQRFEVPGKLVFSDENPHLIVKRIRKAGHHNSKIAILGGSGIYTGFLDAGLVHEFWITLEPKLFGQGTPLVLAESEVPLKLLEMNRLGPSTLLLKYRCAPEFI